MKPTKIIAKYESAKRWARWAAITAALTFGSLYLVEEESHPALYFAIFILFQMAVFAMIAITVFMWRYKKKHAIDPSL